MNIKKTIIGLILIFVSSILISQELDLSKNSFSAQVATFIDQNQEPIVEGEFKHKTTFNIFQTRIEIELNTLELVKPKAILMVYDQEPLKVEIGYQKPKIGLSEAGSAKRKLHYGSNFVTKWLSEIDYLNRGIGVKLEFSDFNKDIPLVLMSSLNMEKDQYIPSGILHLAYNFGSKDGILGCSTLLYPLVVDYPLKGQQVDYHGVVDLFFLYWTDSINVNTEISFGSIPDKSPWIYPTNNIKPINMWLAGEATVGYKISMDSFDVIPGFRLKSLIKNIQNNPDDAIFADVGLNAQLMKDSLIWAWGGISAKNRFDQINPTWELGVSFAF